jgi:hypothetical protein
MGRTGHRALFYVLLSLMTGGIWPWGNLGVGGGLLGQQRTPVQTPVP